MAITSIDQVTKDLGENHLTNPEGDAPPRKDGKPAPSGHQKTLKILINIKNKKYSNRHFFFGVAVGLRDFKFLKY